MGARSRTALLLLVSATIIGWSGISFAYRPFDSTDAAVADVGQLEVELGPVQFRRSNEEQTVIAPAYVLNYGFAKNWELVLEGRGEHPLAPVEETRSRFVGDTLFLKGVLREGALQDKSGPSVATEFGALTPGFNDEAGWGASWLGIVSQRWSGGTIHFDLGAAYTRAHRGDLFVGTIFEGPYDWTVRPVAEVVYEREFNTVEIYSVLAGAIWRVSDDLSFDVGFREAWFNRQPVTEIRAGLTFASSFQTEAMQRSSRSWAQRRDAASGQPIASEPVTPQVGMVTLGPSVKLSLEAGGGWAHNSFEESNDFTVRGFVGGVSAEVNYPIGGIAYIGLSVSVLGSSTSGTIADPITSHIRLLVPIDSIIGLTFGSISVYGFGGLAIGDVKISVPPLSATQSMAGWSVGIGADVQLTPTLSAGMKYRHFDLAKQDFSIFPDSPSLVRERGDTVTGTLSWRIPMSR
jgi:opacity protein-like surface antigen